MKAICTEKHFNHSFSGALPERSTLADATQHQVNGWKLLGRADDPHLRLIEFQNRCVGAYKRLFGPMNCPRSPLSFAQPLQLGVYRLVGAVVSSERYGPYYPLAFRSRLCYSFLYLIGALLFLLGYLALEGQPVVGFLTCLA